MNNRDFTFYDTHKYKCTLSLVTAVFFYLFIIFFLPFGVDNYNPDHQYTSQFLIEISYFFLAIFLISLANEFLLRPLFFRRANFKRILLWSLWTLILFASVIFLLYNFLGNWHDFKFSSYLGFIRDTSGISIFPILGVFFYFRYRSLQSHIQYIAESKDTASNTDHLLTFTGSGSKDRVAIAAADFMYGRAQDNYVELYYLANNTLEKFVIRATLSKLIEQLQEPYIYRCHRSYMVNLQQVRSVTGGTQETTLSLGPFNTPVPVSKTYRTAILEALDLSDISG